MFNNFSKQGIVNSLVDNKAMVNSCLVMFMKSPDSIFQMMKSFSPTGANPVPSQNTAPPAKLSCVKRYLMKAGLATVYVLFNLLVWGLVLYRKAGGFILLAIVILIFAKMIL